MHPVTRKCPCCGSAFTTDNLKRKYCSDTCRNTHQMRKKRARSKARKARIETSAAREALEGKTHLSISEAAKFLGVCRPTLYARIEQGELTPLRVSSRTVRIPIEQLQVDSQLKPQPAKGDWSVLISKAEVLQKYNISESWLMRRMKEEGFRPRIIKDKTPKFPAEIRKNYMRSGYSLKYYHLGQKRFSEETQAAGVTKVRTEGNYVWYKKDELDKLFKKISDNGSN